MKKFLIFAFALASPFAAVAQKRKSSPKNGPSNSLSVSIPDSSRPKSPYAPPANVPVPDANEAVWSAPAREAGPSDRPWIVSLGFAYTPSPGAEGRVTSGSIGYALTPAWEVGLDLGLGYARTKGLTGANEPEVIKGWATSTGLRLSYVLPIGGSFFYRSGVAAALSYTTYESDDYSANLAGATGTLNLAELGFRWDRLEVLTTLLTAAYSQQKSSGPQGSGQTATTMSGNLYLPGQSMQLRLRF